MERAVSPSQMSSPFVESLLLQSDEIGLPACYPHLLFITIVFNMNISILSVHTPKM